jgi:hypothetical protein
MKAIPIIGRDPALTMAITMLIGKRAQRDRVRKRRIAIMLAPFKSIKLSLGI